MGYRLLLASRIMTVMTCYNQISWSTTFVDHDISLYDFPPFADVMSGFVWPGATPMFGSLTSGPGHSTSYSQ